MSAGSYNSKEQAIAEASGDPRRLTELGSRFLKQNDLENAEQSFRLAWQLRPDNNICRFNLAIALKRLCRFEEADRHFEQIHRNKPDCPLTLAHLGDIYRECAEFEKGIVCFKRALDLQPDHHDARFGLSLIYFLQGKWVDAWPLYESRVAKLLATRRVVYEIPEAKRWNGSPAAGKTLLVVWEQGVGDLIQFSRYLAAIRPRVGKLLLFCPQRFHHLLGSLGGVDQFVTSAAEADWDYAAYLLSLPVITGTTIDNVPFTQSYLQPPADRKHKWRNKMDVNTFNVGLCWAGSPSNPRDRLRSIPAEAFEPLFHLPGVTYHSLQVGPRVSDLNGYRSRFTIVDWSEQLNDYADTAGLIHHIDLIITCDTSVAHLAGAMGKPVWMLVSHVPDWRWPMNCTHCPWYQSMRLFRQPTPNDWHTVITGIQSELANSTAFKRSA